MFELDQVWSKMLHEASIDAAKQGRNNVVEYLSLRATNDAIRKAGIDWILDTFVAVASRTIDHRTNLAIFRDDPHNFARETSNMVGSRIEIRQGVRCLCIEAGWARTPADGIMRGGALAFARVTHFGMPKYSAEYRLVHSDPLPAWLSDDDIVIGSGEVERHFNVFIAP